MDESKAKITASGNPISSPVCDLRQSWQRWTQDHEEYQAHNPFSGDNTSASTKAVHYRKEDPEYGRPKHGSKTEQRGKDAHAHLGREVQELCCIIESIGEKSSDGNISVTFKRLFEQYVTISNKLVGVLLRARKHGLVHFEGEMLWQGRDDAVIITLFH